MLMGLILRLTVGHLMDWLIDVLIVECLLLFLCGIMISFEELLIWNKMSSPFPNLLNSVVDIQNMFVFMCSHCRLYPINRV